MTPIEPIVSSRSPREILESDSPLLRGTLRIAGGWGYTQADACIIDKNDPSVERSIPFDGIELERLFVEKRIFEEMKLMRPESERFEGINWKPFSQELVDEAGCAFGKLTIDVVAFHEKDLQAADAEFQASTAPGTPEFDRTVNFFWKELDRRKIAERPRIHSSIGWKFSKNALILRYGSLPRTYFNKTGDVINCEVKKVVDKLF